MCCELGLHQLYAGQHKLLAKDAAQTENVQYYFKSANCQSVYQQSRMVSVLIHKGSVNSGDLLVGCHTCYSVHSVRSQGKYVHVQTDCHVVVVV